MQTDVRERMLLLYVQIIKVLVTELENKWVKFLSKSKSTFTMSKSRDRTWIVVTVNSENSSVPLNCVRKAIDAFCERARAAEEIELTKREMLSGCLQNEQCKVAHEMEKCRKNASASSCGKLAILGELLLQ